MNAPCRESYERPTSLYRHFSADGTLLYVGISLSWPMRTKAHAGRSSWFNSVASVKIEQFPSREEALKAERAAIKAERPKFNVAHNRPERKPRPEAFAPRLSGRTFVKGDWTRISGRSLEPQGLKPKCGKCGAARPRWSNYVSHEYRCQHCFDDLAATDPCRLLSSKERRRYDRQLSRQRQRPQAVDPHYHVLSTGDVDSLDEIDGDEQSALVLCETHKRYEWHYLPRDVIGHTGTLIRRTRL